MDTLFELDSCLDELALKNLDSLFNHPGFRLIFIDDNGSMSLRGPFNDEESRKNIRDKGYRCVSHLWGTADKTVDYVWIGHGIKNVTWKAEVREEKRKRVMQIFRQHKGYFWMDVFCTNQEDVNKPLEVMGDIYRHCKECVCLLDTICDVPGYTSERELWIDVAKDIKEYIGSDREHMDSKYDHLHKPSSNDNSSDISFGAKYLQYLESTQYAKWFGRVWTWQEAALPPKLLFCSEEAGRYRYDPYSPELLRTLFPYKCLEKDWLTRLCKDVYDSSASDSESDNDETDVSKKLLDYHHISNCLNHMKFFSAKYNNIWDNVRAMVVSPKKCTNIEDFVYGITGILNIAVPKGLTLDKAVVELEKGLQKYGIVEFGNEHAYPETPNNLQELYGNKLFIDGVNVLGKVDITTLSKFSTNVDIFGYEEYEISSKKDPDNEGHVCYTCAYKTRIWHVYLKTDSYNVGDILKTTKIGRKGCTFGGYGQAEKASAVAKMVNGVIKNIGGIILRESDKLPSRR